MKELKDATGFPVPEDVQQLWADAAEPGEMLRSINSVIMTLMSAAERHPLQYKEVNLPDALACAKQLREHLRRALPYAVCPGCQGVLRTSCKICKGRGAISKFLWDSPVVTPTIKALRSKAAKC